MAIQILSILVLVALAALGLYEVRSLRAVLVEISNRQQHLPPVPPAEETAKNTDASKDLYFDLQQTKLAVSDGIARNTRAEKRIEKSIASARRLVAQNGLEHPGLEAEAAELRAGDDDRSEEPELQPVRSEVVPDRPTGIPGISRADLRELGALSA